MQPSRRAPRGRTPRDTRREPWASAFRRHLRDELRAAHGNVVVGLRQEPAGRIPPHLLWEQGDEAAGIGRSASGRSGIAERRAQPSGGRSPGCGEMGRRRRPGVHLDQVRMPGPRLPHEVEAAETRQPQTARHLRRRGQHLGVVAELDHRGRAEAPSLQTTSAWTAPSISPSRHAAAIRRRSVDVGLDADHRPAPGQPRPQRPGIAIQQEALRHP